MASTLSPPIYVAGSMSTLVVQTILNGAAVAQAEAKSRTMRIDMVNVGEQFNFMCYT